MAVSVERLNSLYRNEPRTETILVAGSISLTNPSDNRPLCQLDANPASNAPTLAVVGSTPVVHSTTAKLMKSMRAVRCWSQTFTGSSGCARKST